MLGNLRGWRRGGRDKQGHTREHKARLRALQLTRQARAWAHFHISRFIVTLE